MSESGPTSPEPLTVHDVIMICGDHGGLAYEVSKANPAWSRYGAIACDIREWASEWGHKELQVVVDPAFAEAVFARSPVKAFVGNDGRLSLERDSELDRELSLLEAVKTFGGRAMYDLAWARLEKDVAQMRADGKLPPLEAASPPQIEPTLATEDVPLRRASSANSGRVAWWVLLVLGAIVLLCTAYFLGLA